MKETLIKEVIVDNLHFQLKTVRFVKTKQNNFYNEHFCIQPKF